jgi:hypothetical protein
VHDARCVRLGQCVGGLERIACRFGDAWAAPPQQGLQRLALDQLHRDEVDAVRVPDLVNGDHAGVIERGGGPRFAQKPLPRLGILQLVRRQHLDRGLPPEHRVARAVDLAHASRTEPRNEIVLFQRTADQAGRGVHQTLLRIASALPPRIFCFSTGGMGSDSIELTAFSIEPSKWG